MMRMSCSLVLSLGVGLVANVTAGSAFSTLPMDDHANLNSGLGQTFTVVNAGRLQSITLTGGKFITEKDQELGAGDPITIILWKDQDGDPGTWGVGEKIASTASQSLTHDGETRTSFSFASGVQLVSGGVYAITLNRADGKSELIRFGVSGENSTQSGRLFSDGNSVFQDRVDLAMEVVTSGAGGGSAMLTTLPSNNQANFKAPVGQTFTMARNGNVSAVEVAGGQTTGDGDAPYTQPVAVVLRKDGDGDHSTWDPGAELSRSSASRLIHDGKSVTTFTFSDTSVLSRGEVYALEFVDAGGKPTNVRLGLTDAKPLADGTLFHQGRAVFDNRLDLAMRLVAGGELETSSTVKVHGLSLELRRK